MVWSITRAGVVTTELHGHQPGGDGSEDVTWLSPPAAVPWGHRDATRCCVTPAPPSEGWERRGEGAE